MYRHCKSSSKTGCCRPVKITDGSQGNGKVLTSDALGNAGWANASYGKTERFQFLLFCFSGTTNYGFSTKYNYSTATASYVQGETYFKILINKSGLYPFDAHVDETGTGDLTGACSVSLQYGTSGNYVTSRAPLFYVANPNFSTGSIDKSFESYVNGPVYFLFDDFRHGTNKYNLSVIGHLIAE